MWNKLCAYKNILDAYQKARKGKTKKQYIIKFEKELGKNIKKLQKELISKTYAPKPLKNVIIKDPKTRKISKSRFRDRVIHHTIINIVGPLFQKSFIYDSHANQIGKGTSKALERFEIFKRKVSRNNTCQCYVLKADIRHYFEEIDHGILLDILRKRIDDENVMWLIKKVLSNTASSASGGGEEPKVCL